MRRKILGLAIAAVATIGPMQAWGGDREIAETIMSRLQDNRDSGALKNFTLDMKVDKGVVLFRGNVNDQSQKNLVLKAANGLIGVNNVVDELNIKPVIAKQEAAPAKAEPTFTFRDALAAEAEQLMAEESAESRDEGPTTIATTEIGAPAPIAVAAPVAQEVMPGEIRPAGAVEPRVSGDQQIVANVVRHLSKAQKSGVLKGFGVDVKSQNGVVSLNGRAASSAQRARILQIAESVPGVQRVRNSIRISQAATRVPAPAPATQPAPRLPQPPALSTVAQQTKTRLSPVSVDPVSAPVARPQAAPVAAPIQAMPAPLMAQPAPYRAPQMSQPLRAQPVHQVMSGAPVMGTPVPMGGYGGGAIGAPRYDSPNLPNYAWPGYASYPNYAALTYPQQYSPSAWPYIGPFYPYPQVPLGWRKVSLEWDDGWWQLDFTDR